MTQVVCALVRDNDGEYLFLRRAKDGPYGGMWCFPGGKVEPGERPLDAVQREVREETNLDVQVDFLLDKFQMGNYEFTYWLCTERNSRCIELSDEHDSYRWESTFRGYTGEFLDELTPADRMFFQRRIYKLTKGEL